MTLLNSTDTAKRLGMTKQAFYKGVKSGRFTVAKRSDKGHPFFDFANVKKQYDATRILAEFQDGAAYLPKEYRGGRPKKAATTSAPSKTATPKTPKPTHIEDTGTLSPDDVVGTSPPTPREAITRERLIEIVETFLDVDTWLACVAAGLPNMAPVEEISKSLEELRDVAEDWLPVLRGEVSSIMIIDMAAGLEKAQRDLQETEDWLNRTNALGSA